MTEVDRIIKGAPPPDLSPDQLAAQTKAISHHSITAPIPPAQLGSQDPRDALPSSPPQIYLNLLILESSLRLQYLSLRARLRLHMLLLLGLALWVAACTYLLFFRPREDGSGVGGSVYWVVEAAEKLGWCGGCITACLFWGSGMYARGVRWPRRFISTTNRGLRGFNLKVVVVRGGLWAELAGWLALLDPLGWWREPRVNFQLVPRDLETGSAAGLPQASQGKDHHLQEHWAAHAHRHGWQEEDVAPGGDALRVLLLPKPFSPDFRQGWDSFRADYWARENARRRALRAAVRAQARAQARRDGGWLWWTGWRGWRNVRLFARRAPRALDPGERLTAARAAKRLRDRLRDGEHSRGSSRSSTPAPDDGLEKPGSRRGSVASARRHRRTSSSASSNSAAAEGGVFPRRPRKGLSGNEKSRLSATESLFESGWDSGQGGLSMTKLSDAKHEASSSRPVTPIKAEPQPVFADEIKTEPMEQ